MKRLFLVFIILLTVVFITGCRRAEDIVPPATEPPPITTPDPTEPDEPFMPTVPVLEPGSLRIATPRGPAALGLLYLMEQSQSGNTRNEHSFHLVGAPDEIPPLLMRGEIDIAAVPPNMAAILYNNPALDIQVIAVPTLGVLHIVDTTGTINSVEDLRGRTIFSSGVGGTPEFILNHILLSNDLTPGVDVIIEFRPEHTEIAALLEGGLAEIAMLPEPFATTTVMRVENLEYALDLTQEWNRISPDAGLAMTSVIATREVIEEQPDAIQIFLAEYQMSVEFIQQNVDEAAELAVSHDIIPNPNIARAAIPRANIVFITGEQMQRYLEGMLNIFYEQLPQSVGGQMPDADFYFIY